jgi:hypothetical protein
MRIAVLACWGCGVALDPDELMWCEKCLPRCDNCGATDHDAGPIDPVTCECTECVLERGEP